MLCPVPAAQDEWNKTPRWGLTAFLPSNLPILRRGIDNPLVMTSLSFTVSVCLGDVEYSIACWERGLMEATERLEQIYLEVYVTRRASGSLKVWFSVATEQGEQLRFLREAEARAIKTVAMKLQSGQRITSQMIFPGVNLPTIVPQNGEPESEAAPLMQRVQKWREDASVEARRGTNWSHDWSSRTHSYRLGQALDELARIEDRNQNGN